MEIGAVAPSDDRLAGTLAVVLGAGGEVLGVEYVGSDHDVLDEGVSAFQFEGVAGIQTLDEIVDCDAVEGAGFGYEADDGEACGFKSGLEHGLGRSGAVGRDPVDDDAEETFAKSTGGGFDGVGVEVTREANYQDRGVRLSIGVVGDEDVGVVGRLRYA